MKDLGIETARERLAVCENIGWLHQNTKFLSGVFSDDTNSDMNSDDDMSRSGRETPPPRPSHAFGSEYRTPPMPDYKEVQRHQGLHWDSSPRVLSITQSPKQSRLTETFLISKQAPTMEWHAGFLNEKYLYNLLSASGRIYYEQNCL